MRTRAEGGADLGPAPPAAPRRGLGAAGNRDR